MSGRPNGSNPFHPSRGPLAAVLPPFPRCLELPIPLCLNLVLMPAQPISAACFLECGGLTPLFLFFARHSPLATRHLFILSLAEGPLPPPPACPARAFISQRRFTLRYEGRPTPNSTRANRRIAHPLKTTMGRPSRKSQGFRACHPPSLFTFVHLIVEMRNVTTLLWLLNTLEGIP